MLICSEALGLGEPRAPLNIEVGGGGAHVVALPALLSSFFLGKVAVCVCACKETSGDNIGETTIYLYSSGVRNMFLHVGICGLRGLRW